MVKKFEYLENLKSNKTKAITITIEESLIKDVEEIAEKLQVSRNLAISEALRKFTEDYEKFERPNYYIINASLNSERIVNSHLHMLNGNKASIWEKNLKLDIDEEEGIEVGDYVFIWLDNFGIIGAGEVISERNYSSYSIVEKYLEDETGLTEYEPCDEWYVNIDYDKKANEGSSNDINLEKVLTIEELNYLFDELIENAEEKFKRHQYFERYTKYINDDIENGKKVISVGSHIGMEMKKVYLKKAE